MSVLELPTEIRYRVQEAHSPARLADIVQAYTEYSPDQPALFDSEGVWSYSDLNDAIESARHLLANLGVRAGDRVMVVGDNCRAFAAALLALNRLDAWPVPVNPRLSDRELDQICDHCGARLVVYLTGNSRSAALHAVRSGALNHEFDWSGRIALGALNLQTLPEPVDPDPAQRVAALIYTSGTTGAPKGVMLTNGNLLFAASGSAKIRSLTPEDSIYGILPLSHVAGLSVAFVGGLLSGASIHLIRQFNPAALLSSLENGELSVLLGTPALYGMLTDYAKLKGRPPSRFPRLRVISTAGGPLDAALKSAVEAFFALTLQNAYGMTECSPNIAQTRIEAPRCDTSAGPMFPGVEAKLVGPDGNAVAEGEIGELRVRGPNVMKGYYRAPKETAEVLDAEGWFNTRDLARMESRNLFIVGRAKDLIVRFGFNVYPAEVEAVLDSHPAVVRAAVIGRPAPGAEGGEEVVAFVQPRSGAQPSEGDLLEYSASRLATYKRPSRIILIPEMPVTSTGKIIKGELQQAAAGAR